MVKKLLKMKPESFLYLTILIVLLAIFVVIPEDGEKINTRNSNASYHTLLMVKNLRDMPIKEHGLLPIVTMKNGDPTAWGECLRGTDGNYYYCSFMPLDVIVPYLFFSLTGLSLTLKNLYILSLLFCYCSTVILCKIIFQIFKREGKESFFFGFLAAMIYIFSNEGLHCLSNVFWGELIFQPIMLGTLYLIVKQRKHLQTTSISICMLAGFGCMIDWGGYFFVFGILLYYLIEYCRSRNKEHMQSTILLFLFMVLAGVIVTLHYSIKISWNTYFEYCLKRFFSRSAMTEAYNINIFMLAKEYWNSYELWLVVIVAPLFLWIKNIRNRDEERENQAACLFMLAFTCVENILMMQHAIEFSYDRIKFAPIIVILCVYLYSKFYIEKKYFLILVLFTSIYSLRGYLFGLNGYINKDENYIANQPIADFINNRIIQDDYGKIYVGLNPYCSVRGYSNLLFDCNIYEGYDQNGLKQLCAQHGVEKYVYILTDYSLTDKYHVIGALTGSPEDDNATYYSVDETGKIFSKEIETSDIVAMAFSDRSFTQGVNLSGSTIRFQKDSEFANEILSDQNIGYILLSNGKKYKIESITWYDESADVKLLGDYPSWIMKQFEYPNVMTLQ